MKKVLLPRSLNTKQFLRKITGEIGDNERGIHHYFKRVIVNLYGIFPKNVLVGSVKYLITGVISSLIVLTALITFQNANATEIAIVDIEKVLGSSIAMKNVNRKLDSKKSQMQKELEREEEKLNAKKDDIASKSKILSKKAMEEKMIEFQRDIVTFQKKVRTREDELQKAYIGAVAEVTDEVKIIVEEIRADEKYKFDVAISSPIVIYANDNLDISAEVLRRLNKRLKKVSLGL